MLLTALFLSSCYWQPVPINTSLAYPWSDNTTTFSHALSALSIPQDGRPTVVRLLDRCWCDLSSVKLFEPFDIAGWERASVERVKEDMEREEREARRLSMNDEKERDATESEGAVIGEELAAAGSQSPKVETSAPSADRPQEEQVVKRKGITSILRSLSLPRHAVDLGHNLSKPVSQSLESVPILETTSISSPLTEKRPLLRREYDLRPYGLAMIIDFGWSRQGA
ncbi:hypothetical protein HETIRDRAFT_100025 [Heterobasidion irregulare TC 32-1]|uniref:Uncharacterized protein n=1 Tax=Heterobasidion irregulare (strain TC 32-1) TaxID=747525 RepID=W4KPH4_HETIT|nr:uncharacterized protein HETIRDRAFT_100025 [Heterobasidion irregulare TC 32-1]ETW87712.1 hypothetical protein HETIRDRAFT_100025 [Heterobasidion irregulare TC 32-1]